MNTNKFTGALLMVLLYLVMMLGYVDAGAEILYGERRSGIKPANAKDEWVFAGDRGDLVVINLSSNEFDAYLRLYDANYNLLAEDDDGGSGPNAALRYELSESGLYTIGVDAYGSNGSGRYELSLDGEPRHISAPPAQDDSEGLQRAQAGVTRNADWTPVIREFDGVEMVLVPSGCFMMGSDEYSDDEQPVHEQCFDEPYWIDRYEVTQGDFARLGGEQRLDSYFDGANRPVEQITWYEARDFCALRGGRLPTEREWEYAARGPDGLVYPWGYTWDENRVVWDGNSGDETASVGSRPDGVSWVGAEDMSGNVWEWVSSVYVDYPYTANSEDLSGDGGSYVLRGGSWYINYPPNLRASLRNGFGPNVSDVSLGFRCARSHQDDVETSTASGTVVVEPPVENDGRAPVTRNADWTPQMQEFDGVEMVLVPSGCFMMGSNAYSHEQPVHEQCFDEPFWIDRYEVTQGDFARLGGEQRYDSYFDGANRPVESITWYEARDFCELRGGRLPTEREWEYAARGPDGLVYPWGNTWDANRVVWRGDETASVGSRPDGVSWVGAEDMSGNVWEWVSSVYVDYPYGANSEDLSGDGEGYVLRGGSWGFYYPSLLRASYRDRGDPIRLNNLYGFRCARS